MIIFEPIGRFVNWAQTIGAFNTIRLFIEQELLIINLVLLGVGFIVLLIEIRLPLKHYWDLPGYALRRLLQNLHILPSPPVWGTVKDDETNQRIPLAVIELVDRKTLRVVGITFSNRLGEFGFKIKPGSYFVRAVKNYYQMPSFLDPENIELVAVDESFAMPIEVNDADHPIVHMRLLRISSEKTGDTTFQIRHYFKTLLIAASNGSLAFAVIISYFGWVIGRSPIYGLLIIIAILFLFIKIYILEAVGMVSQSE